MIEHYSLYDIKHLTDRFGLTNGVPKGVKPRYNISPVQTAPVVVKSGDTIELRMMKWGLVPKAAKDTNSVFRYKTFNTKSEQVFSKPAWETAVRQQRCIIPANGFYMSRNGDESNDMYYFAQSDASLMSLAGMFTDWTDPEGNEWQMYTLLTIESNKAMPLPFRRMPVLLHESDEAKWLDASVQDFSSMVTIMRPYEGPTLGYCKVTSDVASAKNDDPLLIQPIAR